MLSIHLTFLIVAPSGSCTGVAGTLQLDWGEMVPTVTTLLLKGWIVHAESSQDFNWAL